MALLAGNLNGSLDAFDWRHTKVWKTLQFSAVGLRKPYTQRLLQSAEVVEHSFPARRTSKKIRLENLGEAFNEATELPGRGLTVFDSKLG